MTLNPFQIIEALEEQKVGRLSPEDCLMRLVIVLRERPHLLCGLSMWVPPVLLRQSSAACFLEIRAGISDTLRRSKANPNKAALRPHTAA